MNITEQQDRIEVLASMGPGNDLDTVYHAEVIGRKVNEEIQHLIPRYSTDISLARRALKDSPYEYEVERSWTVDGWTYTVSLSCKGGNGIVTVGGGLTYNLGIQELLDTEEHAIILALIIAKMRDI